MRLLGVLGGMSWASTATYYRLINEGVERQLGGLHSARLLLHSVDFDEVARLQHDADWDGTATILSTAAQGLAAGGAEALVLATNTMHKVSDEIQDAAGIPLLHIADATAASVSAAGIDRIGLMATAFTMEQDFYTGRLRTSGIDCVVPTANVRAGIHQIIYDELCHGITTDTSRAFFRSAMSELVASGAQAIVFGCTEIGLLVGPEDTDVPVFDTTALHAEAAVSWLVGNLPS